MKHSAVLLALGIATATIAADAMKPQLTVMRPTDRPTIEGPAANFTGKAKIDRQVRPEDSRPLGSMVSFEPGARWFPSNPVRAPRGIRTPSAKH